MSDVLPTYLGFDIRLQRQITQLQTELQNVREQLTEAQSKYDLEHEAYMDLFRQLSEYERKALERPVEPAENGGAK